MTNRVFPSEKENNGGYKKSLITAILKSHWDSVWVPNVKMRNSSQLIPSPLPSKTLGTLGSTILEVLLLPCILFCHI